MGFLVYYTQALNMKFAASLSLLGLASATPVAQQEAKSASQSATVLADAPVWAWSAAYIADDYYQTNWHYTLSLEEVPNSGENIHALCNGISNWSEGWCPGPKITKMMSPFQTQSIMLMPSPTEVPTVLTMSTVADQSTTMMPIFKTLSPQPLDSSTIPLLHQTTVPLSVCIMDTATISITLN